MSSQFLRFFTIAFFLFINFFGSASESETSLYPQLRDLNAQWEKHQDYAKVGNVVFESDLDLIQYHLEQVISSLRSNSSSWRNQQLKNRLGLLDILEKYAARKVFPTNLYHSKRTPYFIDDFGVHCAVGYLIQQSGNEDLALKISKEFNYSYIENIDSPEMIRWAEKFGFTVDELKWIQPSYAPTEPLDTLGNGTNGNVKKVYADYFNSRIIFVGAFDSVDLQPCLNIGTYENDQLACFGGGIAGVVNDVYATTDGIYVAGALESNGLIYPLALYDGTTWSFFSIPQRPGATGTNTLKLSLSVGSPEMEVTIEHPSLNGDTEIWIFTAPNAWVREARVNGPILDLQTAGSGQHLFAGHFDSLIRYTPVPYSVQAKNVVVKETLTDTWYGVGTELSDTVKVIYSIGTAIYFGGSCSNDPGVSDVCLTRYLNGSLQTLVERDGFSNSGSSSINDIGPMNGGLIIGGNFEFQPFMGGTIGTSLVYYDLVWNDLIGGLALVDDAVNSLAIYNNDIYIGGDFSNQFTNQSINHLGRITSTVGLEEESLEINAYPNPFQNTITVEGFEMNARYSLLDLSGKILVKDEQLLDGNLDFTDVENGIYVLQIQTSSGTFTERIVKSSAE